MERNAKIQEYACKIEAITATRQQMPTLFLQALALQVQGLKATVDLLVAVVGRGVRSARSRVRRVHLLGSGAKDMYGCLAARIQRISSPFAFRNGSYRCLCCRHH